jgi:hypothetical protein
MSDQQPRRHCLNAVNQAQALSLTETRFLEASRFSGAAMHRYESTPKADCTGIYADFSLGLGDGLMFASVANVDGKIGEPD